MGKIKVLQVLTSVDFGGVERYVAFLVRHLPKTQFDVAVAASARSRNQDLLHAMGVPFFSVPHLCKAIHPWHDAMALAELRGILRRFRPDIVHTHMFKAGFVGRLAARFQGVPAILFTAHGFHFNTFQAPFMKGIAYAVEKTMARYCSHMILPVSQTEAWQAISQKIIHPSKIRTVYPGIETERCLPAPERVAFYRRKIGWQEGEKLIGTVGRLARQKAPLDLVRASALIIRQNPRVRVLFVGDGPLRPKVEAEIRKLGLQGKVHVLGFCTDVDVLLAMMEIFVLPSLFEGQPISIMEAMRNDVPVVAADVNGVSELVRHGDTGLLVPRSQPEMLAQTVLGLLDDPVRRKQLAAAARRHLEAHYSVKVMVDQIQSVYRNLLGAREEKIPCFKP